VQLFDGLKAPTPVLFQVTVPVGVIAVPGDASVTEAVKVTVPFSRTTVLSTIAKVLVVRFVTFIVKTPLLPKCVGSPIYAPVTNCVPSEPDVGVSVIVHVPFVRVQYTVPVKGVRLKLVVPVGFEAVVEEVSVTVAVHRVGWLTTRLEGLQLTTVLVLSGFADFTTATGVPFRADTGMSPHIWVPETVTLAALTQLPAPPLAVGSQYWSVVPVDTAEFVMQTVAVPVLTPLM
jgi:hypothetical protein